MIEKEEPDKIAMVMDYWMKLLQRDPAKNLGKIPSPVKRRLPIGFENNLWDAYFKNLIATADIFAIRTEYSKCTDILRKNLSNDVKVGVAKAWVKHLGHDKDSYKEINQCPQDIRNLMSPEDLQAPRQRMVELVYKTPSYYDRNMPPEIFQYLPDETKQKVRMYWGTQIYTLPKRFESCPDEVRKTFKEGFEMTAWDRYIRESLKRGEERVYGGAENTEKWVPRHVREKLSPETRALVVQFYEKHAIGNPARITSDIPTEVLRQFSEQTCKMIAEKITPYIADYPEFVNSLPSQITNHLRKDVESEIWKIKITNNPEQYDNVPDRVKERIDDAFMIQAWMKTIAANPAKYNDCPPRFLNQIPIQWSVNIWSRHLRANYLDYKKCPDNIKRQINQSTKETVARSFANEITKTPLNRDYYTGRFQTNWPMDPEILMLLPEDTKNKLRRADIDPINAILGPLRPMQPPAPPKRRNAESFGWYKKADFNSDLLQALVKQLGEEKGKQLAENIDNEIKSIGTQYKFEGGLKAVAIAKNDACIISDVVLTYDVPNLLFTLFHELTHYYQYKKYGHDFALSLYLNPVSEVDEDVYFLKEIESTADKFARLKTTYYLKKYGINKPITMTGYKFASDEYLKYHLMKIKMGVKGMKNKSIEQINEYIYNVMKIKTERG